MVHGAGGEMQNLIRKSVHERATPRLYRVFLSEKMKFGLHSVWWLCGWSSATGSLLLFVASDRSKSKLQLKPCRLQVRLDKSVRVKSNLRVAEARGPV